MHKTFFYAVATLIGTTIGAGILGIPYVVSQSGLLFGLLNIAVLGIAIIIVNLYMGEVVLRTKETHQLTGYAKIYLGELGKKAMAGIMIFVNYGAMTAYLIGIGAALGSIFGKEPLWFSIGFFLIGSGILFLGLKAFERSELALTSLILAILFGITIAAVLSDGFTAGNLAYSSLSKIAVPYGVVLFAFLGAVAIPEMHEELGKNKKLLKKAIITGGLIPVVAYALFAIAIVGITGNSTTEVATVGLADALGDGIALFANLFAVFAMSTSFLALGLALKEMYHYDYKVNRKFAWLATIIVPILAFIMGINDFIILLGLLGAVGGATELTMIVLMHHRAKKLGKRAPEYSLGDKKAISAVLVLMFLAGVIYQFL